MFALVSFTRAASPVDGVDDVVQVLVLVEAGPGAGLEERLRSRSFAAAVRQTTATPGARPETARVASTPSSPGSR